MKINRKLKHLFIVINDISSIAVASLAFADNGNSDNFIQPLTKSIDKLSKELQALAIANVKSNNDMRYQVDQYFPNTIPKDNDGNNLSQSTQLAGSALTQQQVNQLL